LSTSSASSSPEASRTGHTFSRFQKGWDTAHAGAPKAQKWYYSFLPHGIAGGVTQPAIPLYVTEGLGGTVADVGIVSATGSLASIPAFLFWGAASDGMRRRRLFVLIGFVGMALSLLFMAAAVTVREYYLANLLLGALAAASAPVGPVLIMETAQEPEWPQRLALFNRLGGLGWVVGLGIGAVWVAVETAGVGIGTALQALFVIGASLALLSAWLVWRWVPEPEVTVDRHAVHLPDLTLWFAEKGRYMPQRVLHYFDPRRLLGAGKLPRGLRVYLASAFLLFAGFTAFYAILPVFLVRGAHLPLTQVFLVYLTGHLVSALSYPAVGRWVAARGAPRAQVLASTARVVLFPSFFLLSLFPLAPTSAFPAVLVLHTLVGLCWAAINVSGSMIVSGLANPEARAEAMGAYNAVQGFGSVLGPVAAGMLAGALGLGTGFLAAAAFVAGGVVILAQMRLAAPAEAREPAITAS
jgi:MFS family permease